MLCIILNPTYLNFVVVNFYHKITTFLGKKKSKQKRRKKTKKNPNTMNLQFLAVFTQHSSKTISKFLERWKLS